MKQVCKIMDEMGAQRALADARIAEEARKREELDREKMEALKKEQQDLKNQLENSKTYKVKVISPEKEARRLRRQTMVASVLSSKQKHLEQLKQLKLSDDFKDIVAGTSLADESAMQTLKLLIAKDLEPLMEKKIRSEMEILIKSKIEEAREEALKRAKGSQVSVE